MYMRGRVSNRLFKRTHMHDKKLQTGELANENLDEVLVAFTTFFFKPRQFLQ